MITKTEYMEYLEGVSIDGKPMYQATKTQNETKYLQKNAVKIMQIIAKQTLPNDPKQVKKIFSSFNIDGEWVNPFTARNFTTVLLYGLSAVCDGIEVSENAVAQTLGIVIIDGIKKKNDEKLILNATGKKLVEILEHIPFIEFGIVCPDYEVKLRFDIPDEIINN